jgi:hypothetical protein
VVKASVRLTVAYASVELIVSQAVDELILVDQALSSRNYTRCKLLWLDLWLQKKVDHVHLLSSIHSDTDASEVDVRGRWQRLLLL